MSKNELYIFLAIQVIVIPGIYLSWSLKILLLICIIHLNFVFYTLKLNSHAYFDGLKFKLFIKWCSKIKMMSFCWCREIFSSHNYPLCIILWKMERVDVHKRLYKFSKSEGKIKPTLPCKIIQHLINMIWRLLKYCHSKRLYRLHSYLMKGSDVAI